MSNNAKQTVFWEVHSPEHRFGGTWTSEKLEQLGKYLSAYTKVFKNQSSARHPLYPIYIDAFAGSGLIKVRSKKNPSVPLFPEFAEESVERFIDGSTKVALSIDPPFSKYIFVEKHRARANELKALRERYPDKDKSIVVRNQDANTYLLQISDPKYWKHNRAVLFLDPYGMQVKWSTLEAIASTKAIDVWYLFPLGVGINRLLANDGQIPEYNQLKLDEVFGTKVWREAFYTKSNQMSLLEGGQVVEKKANLDSIEAFFVERLKTIFPRVAQNPLRLYNSKENAIFSFCFASANEGKGGEIALRIASHLLKKNK